jgi:hypothetical protein
MVIGKMQFGISFKNGYVDLLEKNPELITINQLNK